MLSYLHEFHAGNHADVLKHVTLLFVLEHLNGKDRPYTFFDTHAGSGRYRTDDARAVRTGEAGRGILRLLADKSGSSPPELDGYKRLVTRSLEAGFYPGSPEIARACLPAGSRHILSELHGGEFAALKKNMEGSGASVHRRDGYEMLFALTPPEIRRGAALVDPSYEDLSDYRNAERTLAAVRAKWPAGILMLWYPLIFYRLDQIEAMKAAVARAARSSRPEAAVLDARLLVNGERSHEERPLSEAAGSDAPRLYGSGMLVVNAPWKLDEKLSRVLPYLARVLGEDGRGRWSAQFL